MFTNHLKNQKLICFADRVYSTGGAYSIMIKKINKFEKSKTETIIIVNSSRLKCENMPSDLKYCKVVYLNSFISFFAKLNLIFTNKNIRVFMLNSLPIPFRKNQTIYYHFPLIVYGLGIIKRHELKAFLLYIKHQIFSIFYFVSKGKIIVQSDFMKNSLKLKNYFKNWTFDVENTDIKVNKKYIKRSFKKSKIKRLIYPATNFYYKNHYTLLKSLLQFNNEYVLYTNLTSSDLVKKSKDFSKINHVSFYANTKNEMFELYSKSDYLIFPSLAETLGLPLVEAKSINLPIICLDLPYTRSVLGNYKNVFWISDNSVQSWVLVLNKLLI